MNFLSKEKEIRSLLLDNFEVRSLEDKKDEVIIEGYIAKFDSLTEIWDGYFEKIDRTAFDETLADGHNIFLLYHHDISKPLASTRNKTLELSVDNIGLRFKASINKNLSFSNDVYELVSSGEVRGCSFGFYTLKDNEEYDSEKGTITRTLLKVHLVEGTITPIPQYEDTVVQARAKERVEFYKNENDKKSQEIRELEALTQELELLIIKNQLEKGV